MTRARDLSQIHATTSAEEAAGVTPVDATFPAGDIRRYGTNTIPGTTDMSVALQAGIDQNLNGGPPLKIHREPYAFATTLTITLGTAGATILGEGRNNTILSYTGAGSAFVSATPTVRTYNVLMRDFNITDAGTGTIGLDLSSISLSHFENLVITGFTTDVKITSTSNGFAVYNRFYNVNAFNATTGFHILPSGSNANTFYGCRGNVCTTGALIADSNENHFDSCQFDACPTGVSITASGTGLSPRNYINQCRFENGGATNIVIGTNVPETALIMNRHVTGTALSDSGTRTQTLGVSGNTDVLSLNSAMGGATAPAFSFERSANGGAGENPALRIVDSVTSTGTPVSLQIETGRVAGHAIRVLNGVGGTESFGVLADGKIHTNQNVATATVGAQLERMPIYDETGALIGYIPIYAAA